MAAGSLPRPGSLYGPCADENCPHTDCAQTRAMANGICPICGKPIGYDTFFYHMVDVDGAYAHRHCVDAWYRGKRFCIRCGVPIDYNRPFHPVEGSDGYSCDRCHHVIQFIASD